MADDQALGTYCLRIGLTEPIEKQLDDYRRAHIDRKAGFPTPITIGLTSPFQATDRQIEYLNSKLCHHLSLLDSPPIFGYTSLKYASENNKFETIYLLCIAPVEVVGFERLIHATFVAAKIQVSMLKNFAMVLADQMSNTKDHYLQLDPTLSRNMPAIAENPPILRLHLHRQDVSGNSSLWNWPVIKTFAVSKSADAQLA